MMNAGLFRVWGDAKCNEDCGAPRRAGSQKMPSKRPAFLSASLSSFDIRSCTLEDSVTALLLLCAPIVLCNLEQ